MFSGIVCKIWKKEQQIQCCRKWRPTSRCAWPAMTFKLIPRKFFNQLTVSSATESYKGAQDNRKIWRCQTVLCHRRTEIICYEFLCFQSQAGSEELRGSLNYSMTHGRQWDKQCTYIGLRMRLRAIHLDAPAKTQNGGVSSDCSRPKKEKLFIL